MIDEILSKDPKKWKYKECKELVDSNDADPTTKERAKARMAEIKQWLKNKEEAEKKGEEVGKAVNQREVLHLQDIDLSMEALTKISDEVKDNITPLLARYYYIQSILESKGITHPASVGMFFNHYMENQRAKFLGGGIPDES